MLIACAENMLMLGKADDIYLHGEISCLPDYARSMDGVVFSFRNKLRRRMDGWMDDIGRHRVPNRLEAAEFLHRVPLSAIKDRSGGTCVKAQSHRPQFSEYMDGLTSCAESFKIFYQLKEINYLIRQAEQLSNYCLFDKYY